MVGKAKIMSYEDIQEA
jgi:hypothetical protein